MTISQLKTTEPPAMQEVDIPLRTENLRIIIKDNQHYVTLEAISQLAISRSPESMLHWLKCMLEHHRCELPAHTIMQWQRGATTQTAITLQSAVRLLRRSNAREFVRLHDLMLDVLLRQMTIPLKQVKE